jgi:negative regulator of flagellin synthesis FlgM
MTNKINGTDSRLGPIKGSQPVARGQATTSNETSQSAIRNGVQITDGARQLASLEKAIAAIPVVDQARVESVARAIDDGRYVVQNQRIADRLIRMDQEFAAAARRER